MLGCPKLPSDSCSGYHHVELAVRLIEGSRHPFENGQWA